MILKFIVTIDQHDAQVLKQDPDATFTCFTCGFRGRLDRSPRIEHSPWVRCGKDQWTPPTRSSS